jgi:hypothetical protein
MSVSEYAATVTKAINPLDAALKALAEAKAYKGLSRRIKAVTGAAQQATLTLGPVTPPAELAQPHAQLVSALRAFGDELDGLGSKVDGRALCTGSALRAGLGNADATAHLRAALTAVTTKLPGHRPALTLPAAGQKDDARPSNGELIHSGSGDGRGELTISNGGSDDAVVTLAKGKKPAVSIYVRKGKDYTLKGVPNGSYTVFFTGGSGWDDAAHGFGRNCAFQRFEDPLKFRTSRTGSLIRYSIWTISLRKVLGGNARTSKVDPNDFPDS